MNFLLTKFKRIIRRKKYKLLMLLCILPIIKKKIIYMYYLK